MQICGVNVGITLGGESMNVSDDVLESGYSITGFRVIVWWKYWYQVGAVDEFVRRCIGKWL